MNGATGIVTTKKKTQPNLFPDSSVKGKKMLVKRKGVWTHAHTHTHTRLDSRERKGIVSLLQESVSSCGLF